MSLNQGLGLPFGIQVVNPVAVDSWAGPYQSITEANASVPAGVRYIGVTSGVTVGRTVVILYNGVPTDYWWYNGTADGNLVIKNYSSTGGTGTNYSAGNGISISGGTISFTGQTGSNYNPGNYLQLSGNTFIVTGLTPLNYYVGVSGISVNGNVISYTGQTIGNSQNQQIIFNNNGVLSGNTGLQYDVTNKRLNFGSGNQITGSTAIAFGTNNTVGNNSFALGNSNVAIGNYSQAFGFLTQANGIVSHAEGTLTVANGQNSHAEGNLSVAQGVNSHAEGLNTFAGGLNSHAEGTLTVANGQGSHAEGNATIANGFFSHAEGSNTIANGNNSHAGGFRAVATGLTSFVYYDNQENTPNLGANADFSSILGGKGGYIDTTGIGNSLISGNKDIVPTGYTYTTFVKSLYALNSAKPIIIRNSGGTESYISVDNNNQLNFNGIPISSGNTYVAGNGISILSNVISYTGQTGNTYFAGDNLLLSGNTFIVTGLTPSISLSANRFYVSTGGTGYRSSNLIENPSDTNVALDVNSTAKGLIIPKLTTVTRDALTSVPAGLLQYNSNKNTFEFYDSTRWRNVAYLFPDDTSATVSEYVSTKNQPDVICIGQITVTNGSSSITGVGTQFLTDIKVGYTSIFFNDGTDWYLARYSSAQVTTDTTITGLSSIYSLTALYSGGQYPYPIQTTFIGTSGTYKFYKGKSFSQASLSSSFGFNNFIKNTTYTSYIFGNKNIIAGGTNNTSSSFIAGNQNYVNSTSSGFAIGAGIVVSGSFAIGLNLYTQASGASSFAGGTGQITGLATNDPATFKRIIAGGNTAFNFSTNDTSQTIGHGALANQSVILGGLNHNIPSDSPRSVILGGNAIKARATTPDLVYVPSLNIVNNPANSVGSSFTLLGRSSFSGNTGDTITVLLDSNTLAITSNGLSYIGSSGNTYTAGNNISISGNVISYTGQTGSNYVGGNGISVSGNVISYTGGTNSSLGYLVTDKFTYLGGNPVFTATNNIGILVAVEQRGVDLIPGDQFTVTQPSTVQILTGNTAVDINDTFVIKYFTSTGATIQQNITIYSGGTVDNYYTTSVNYTVLPSDCYIECTTGLSVTLITTGIQAGKRYRVKNTSTGTVTVTPTSGTIDNVANKLISSQNDAFDFVWNGTNYKIY